MNNLEQEIEWLKEEIEQDETVCNSSDACQFFRERLIFNRIKLEKMLDFPDE